MKAHISLLLFLFLLISCGGDDGDVTLESVEIRVTNISSYQYDNVFVNTSGGEANFGTIKAGESSNYQSFEKAYRYAFVELEIDGKVFTIQPIDYVGETLLDIGRYSYRINADTTFTQFGGLSIELEQN